MMLKLENERELLSVAGRDEKAFAALYDFYFPKVYGFVFKRVGNHEDAEDLVSQTFLKVFANLEKYAAEDFLFGPFLFKVAANCLIDFYRKNSRKREMSYDSFRSSSDADDDLAFDPPDDATGPNEIAAINEDRRVVLKVLAKMPEKYQRIIQLKFFGELDYAEIAPLMKITENNARVVLHRALKKFHENYEKYAVK